MTDRAHSPYDIFLHFPLSLLLFFQSQLQFLARSVLSQLRMCSSRAARSITLDHRRTIRCWWRTIKLLLFYGIPIHKISLAFYRRDANRSDSRYIFSYVYLFMRKMATIFCFSQFYFTGFCCFNRLWAPNDFFFSRNKSNIKYVFLLRFLATQKNERQNELKHYHTAITHTHTSFVWTIIFVLVVAANTLWILNEVQIWDSEWTFDIFCGF